MLLPRQRRELSQAAATFLLLMVSELAKDTDPGHLTNSSVSSRGQPLSQELGRQQRRVGPCRLFCSNWGEPKGSREQLSTGPSSFRAEGAMGEEMGSELKLDSPMKLMGGQILP